MPFSAISSQGGGHEGKGALHPSLSHGPPTAPRFRDGSARHEDRPSAVPKGWAALRHLTDTGLPACPHPEEHESTSPTPCGQGDATQETASTSRDRDPDPRGGHEPPHVLESLVVLSRSTEDRSEVPGDEATARSGPCSPRLRATNSWAPVGHGRPGPQPVCAPRGGRDRAWLHAKATSDCVPHGGVPHGGWAGHRAEGRASRLLMLVT